MICGLGIVVKSTPNGPICSSQENQCRDKVKSELDVESSLFSTWLSN